MIYFHTESVAPLLLNIMYIFFSAVIHFSITIKLFLINSFLFLKGGLYAALYPIKNVKETLTRNCLQQLLLFWIEFSCTFYCSEP